MSKVAIILTLAFVGTAFAPVRVSAQASEETTAAYLELFSLRDLVTNAARQHVEALPGEQRERAFQVLVKSIDYGALEGRVREALSRSFTDEELAALIQFYGSDVGQSIMRKYPQYIALVTPAVVEQINGTLRTRTEGR